MKALFPTSCQHLLLAPQHLTVLVGRAVRVHSCIQPYHVCVHIHLDPRTFPSTTMAALHSRSPGLRPLHPTHYLVYHPCPIYEQSRVKTTLDSPHPKHPRTYSDGSSFVRLTDNSKRPRSPQSSPMYLDHPQSDFRQYWQRMALFASGQTKGKSVFSTLTRN